ncbi:tetratricopeptide repeat protein [Paenibacillus turicensis]|uniref:J domain-containing protein n=1 Tax=Paenibacillus turicensis TaxID=160487 RepID=UPI003D291FFF
MSPWKRLQLEPTHDAKAIRRAYAQQLKRYHPEEDPEGYQQLRQAYEQIMTEIKAHAVYSPPFSEPQEEEDFQNGDILKNANAMNVLDNMDNHILTPPRLWLQGDGHEPPQYSNQENEDVASPLITASGRADLLLSNFKKQLVELYNDFPSRLQLEKWRTLFDSDICWDLQHRTALIMNLIEVLDQHRYLPQQVWLTIEELFEFKAFWSEDRKYSAYIHEHFPDFQAYYLSQLNEPALSYDGLLTLNGQQGASFVQLRDQGYRALQEQSWIEARYYLKQAYAIYDQDQDVIRLLLECELQYKHIEQALSLAEKLIEIAPKQIDGYMYKANLLFNNDNYTEAAGVYLHIKMYWPQNMDAKIKLAECFIYMKQEKLARKQLRALQQKMPDAPNGHLFKINELLFRFELIKEYKTVQFYRNYDRFMQFVGIVMVIVFLYIFFK